MKENTSTMQSNIKQFQWAVIGAGPAGIAAVGKLLDCGIPQGDLLWLDPEFKVGDFGQKWRNISSNTTVKKFISYLHDAESFDYVLTANDFEISKLDPEQTCQLRFAAEPLQWVTDRIRPKVHSEKATINSMQLLNRTWHLHSQDATFQAKNVILAVGAEALALDYPQIEAIPLEAAIDKEQLAQHISKDDTIAVFGASHSGIIIIRHLIELGIKKVINFYQYPLRYAIDLGDWILFDDTGLKGSTAVWARENIDGQQPSNLLRCYSNNDNIAQHLPQCSKAVYAVGFKKRDTIAMTGYANVQHNPQNGIIAPGLFGLGIAYPEAKPDRYGTVESRVGLFKFMDYINRVLPLWLKYHT